MREEKGGKVEGESYNVESWVRAKLCSYLILHGCFREELLASEELVETEVDAEYFDVDYFKGRWEDRAQRLVNRATGKRRSEFYTNKFEQEAARNWDVFYRRNTDKFFKDRHYLLKDFDILRETIDQGCPCAVLEVGCGVGNTLIPLCKLHPHVEGYGIDFASKAIEILTANSADQRCKGMVCDISKESVPADVPMVDFATMIFVLSAISPERMEVAVKNVLDTLKPGGYLLFRDYGELDQAQLRFSEDQRLGHNYYVRQDGTRSFFFSLEGMAWLFEKQCGLKPIQVRKIRRVVLNRAEKLSIRRIFVHAIYQKPSFT